MIQKQSPNRPICSGDMGVESATPHTNAKQRECEREETILSIMTRMEPWSTDFIQRVYKENKNHAWQTAAERMLKKRNEKLTSGSRVKKKKFIPDSIKKSWEIKRKSLDTNSASKRWGIKF